MTLSEKYLAFNLHPTPTKKIRDKWPDMDRNPKGGPFEEEEEQIGKSL